MAVPITVRREDNVLDLLIQKDESTFPQLETKLRQVIRRQVAPFAKDSMLRKVEDVDSLYNIALVKLHEAIVNFVYEPHYDKEHNERRFLSMLSKYIKNAMIDVQYAASAGKRRPKGNICSFDSGTNPESGELESDAVLFDPEYKGANAFDVALAKDLNDAIYTNLGTEERRIFILLQDGYSAEGIAGKLGILISRVRHTIYERIQKTATRFIK
jgi:RNA polymerase sigma factor (sigma-70 family)